MDYKQQIQLIYDENRKYYDDVRGKGFLKSLGRNFPHEWLYVCELIQNALDVKAKVIRISCNEDRFCFEHNGEPFQFKNVRGLCTSGLSTKGLSTVGFMGIGFKSVFTCFEKVSISSGGYQFDLNVNRINDDFFPRLDWLGAVLPIWNDDAELPSEGMTTRFVLSRRDSTHTSLTHLKQVWSEDRSLLPMLIKSGLEQLDWNGDCWTLLKEPLPSCKESGYYLLAEQKETEKFQQWVLFQTPYYPSDKAKKEFTKHRALNPDSKEEREKLIRELEQPRKVSVFCELDEDDLPILPACGYAYAVLPTDIQLPFRFHVQADWLLMTSRTQMMSIEDTDWHKEIGQLVPGLFSALFLWLIGRVKNPQQTRTVFKLFPDLLKEVTDNMHKWWLQVFTEVLPEELAESEFLPVYSQEGSIYFAEPANVFKLHKEFQPLENEMKWIPWRLFSDIFLAGELMEERTIETLYTLGLLEQIYDNQLIDYWGENKIRQWFEMLPEEVSYQALYHLWQALGELSKKNFPAHLVYCVPSESATWSKAELMTKMTVEYWLTFAKETWLQEILLGVVPGHECLLNLGVHRELLKLKSKNDRTDDFDRFIRFMKEYKTDKLIQKWFDEIPFDGEEKIDTILQLTSYIKQNQSQRKNLIKKAIAEDTNGVLKIVPIEEALLADPYVGSYRRELFPDRLVIWKGYAEDNLYHFASSDEWKNFFEAQESKPFGNFGLEIIHKSFDWFYDGDDLKDRLGVDWLPELRSSSYREDWNGIEVDHKSYVLLDYDLPQVWKDAVKTTRHGNSPIQWMMEKTDFFKVSLLYIPFKQGFVRQKEYREVETLWQKTLKNTIWVPVCGEDVLYKPSQVLSEADELRPDYPVADLDGNFIDFLQNNGVRFGSEIPNAPIIRRLEKQGAHLPFEELYLLLDEAIKQAEENEESRTYLLQVLKKTPILPTLNPGIRTSANWVVKDKGVRSDFNKRVVFISDFKKGTIERRIFDRIIDFVNIFPKFVNGSMSLGLLLSIWEDKPQSDEVRRIMPSAFQYLMEDVRNKPKLQQKWEKSKKHVKVFVKNKGWMRLDDVYFNDIPMIEEYTSLKEFKIATPGFFGTDSEKQRQVAEFIELPILSERLKIEYRKSDLFDVPQEWENCLKNLTKAIYEIQKSVQDNDSEESDEMLPLKLPRMVGAVDIYGVVYDRRTGEELSTKQKKAILIDNQFFVTGKPYEFAAELAEHLLELFGLQHRSDQNGKLKRLSARIGAALVLLDREQEFLDVLEQIGADYGLKVEKTVDSVPNSQEQTLPLRAPNVIKSVATRPYSNDTDHPGVTGKLSVPNMTNKRDFLPAIAPIKIKKSGYTKEWRKSSERKFAELLKAKLTGSVIPDTGENENTGYNAPSDIMYRRAAMEYERKFGRIPEEMPANQEGFDIESYDENGQLLRRIEVKGRSSKWQGDEIVTMSRKQVETFMTDENDCWLYIVEKQENDLYKVLPIHNPARLAKSYEFTATLWHFAVKGAKEVSLEDEIEISEEDVVEVE